MERLTHEADFGLEDWEETLFFVKSDPNGAYNIIDIAKYQGEPEFDEILKNVALRLAAYEDTGLEPEAVEHLKLASMGTDQNGTIINIYDKDGNPIAAIPNVEVNLSYNEKADSEEIDGIKRLVNRELHFTMKLTLWQRIKNWWWFRKVKKGWRP